MNHAQVLEDLLRYCLFTDEEFATPNKTKWQGEDIPADSAVFRGVMTSFVFHPGRLGEKAGDIIELARGIVQDEFLVNKGEGWSFLNLINTRDGVHWAEHPTVEKLICICGALGLCDYLLPRKMWDTFHGGMPYLWFDLDASPTPQRPEFPKAFEKWKDPKGVVWSIGHIRGNDVSIHCRVSADDRSLHREHRKINSFTDWKKEA